MRIPLTAVLDRFIRYAGFDTQSDPASHTCPSTHKQLEFAGLLAGELKAMGAADVLLDENGYVFATIPANTAAAADIIGLIAHMDTSPDGRGAHVKPQVIERYNGGDIILNREKNIVLRAADFPEITRYAGQTIVTTDGTTLLGADDKAGIAAIMAAAEYLLSGNHAVPHGAIRIGFTPDEEIGRGADKFDVAAFGADYAYTFDGGAVGELEYENFNAAEAFITVTGNAIHPGYAKNKMINALNIAGEIQAALPPAERPETTAGREGFFHLTTLNGTEEMATMHYIVRDFERTGLEHRKTQLEQIVNTINNRYAAPIIRLALRDQYYNMYEKIIPHPHIIEKARQAMLRVQVTPLITAARGGTDGARLSFMGLPCPNIFAGGHNFHGKYEYLPIESTRKAAEVILELVKK